MQPFDNERRCKKCSVKNFSGVGSAAYLSSRARETNVRRVQEAADIVLGISRRARENRYEGVAIYSLNCAQPLPSHVGEG